MNNSTPGRLVQVGDKTFLVQGAVTLLPPGPDQDTRPRARKRQRIPRDGRMRVTRTGPQIPIPGWEEPALLAMAVHGSRYAIDVLFRAYVGIINVIIHKYNNRATEDDVQDAYELAVRIIRSHDPKVSTLTMHFDRAIRDLMREKREARYGSDATDHSILSLEDRDGRNEG